MQNERFRNFTTILYPESADIIVFDNLHIPGFLSPLHDRDIDQEGCFKKPHYHLLIMFEGKKSIDQVRKLVQSFGGVGLEVVQSIRGAARYLCHLDNPEKAQYSSSMVRAFGGADYNDVIISEADRVKAFEHIEKYIIYNNILYYPDLLRSLQKDGEKDLYRYCLFGLIYPVTQYLKSRMEAIKDLKKGSK